jgi:phosphohistidine phosphatase
MTEGIGRLQYQDGGRDAPVCRSATMTLVLVHHADAVGPDVDSRRPLSISGRHQADQLAGRLKASGIVPAAIWHSGKLRARETAEAFLRQCNPFAEFRMVRGLAPDDPPEFLRDSLMGEPRDVLVVGHMPGIREVGHLLAPASAPLPLHGLIALQHQPEPPRWVELWRLTPD